MIRRYVDQLQAWSQNAPDSFAIRAPGKRALSYRDLWTQVEEAARTLRGGGIRRSDRVAIVLPNGPEMATCFLAAGACCTCAPLNPAYSESEFDFYLSDLSAQALIVSADATSAAIPVARRRGILVIELSPCASGAAGRFQLNAAGPAASG